MGAGTIDLKSLLESVGKTRQATLGGEGLIRANEGTKLQHRKENDQMFKKGDNSGLPYIGGFILFWVLLAWITSCTPRSSSYDSYTEDEREVLERYQRDTEDYIPATKADRM